MNGPAPVRLPVSRLRALTRAILWLTPAVLLALIAWLVFREVQLGSSGLSNRLVDWARLLGGVPLAVAALVMGWHACRWLFMSIWPAFVGFEATVDALHAHLGPFRSHRYDVRFLRIRYPFEQTEADDAGGYESFLPEDQQRNCLLPEISGRNTPEPVNKTILRFVATGEADTAARMRPLLDHWRTLDPTLPVADESSE